MKEQEIIALPSASPGTEKSLKVIRYGSTGSGIKVYIQAGLHADEAPGFLVAHHLEKLFDDADISGEIVLVPVANPIGLGQWRDEVLNGRFHFPTSINFNRQHLDITDAVAEKISGKLTAEEDKNRAVIRTAMAEVIQSVTAGDEAAFLKKQLLTLSHDADIVLDLHCDHVALLHLYMGTPLWPDGADLAAQMQSDVTLLAKNSGSNPFDEACSRPWWELASRFPNHPISPACFSATVELRGISDTAPGTAEKDAENIFHFLQRRGVIKGDAPPLPDLKNEATPLTGVDYVKAEAPGILVFHKQPGDHVDKDEIIAEIINPLPAPECNNVSYVRSNTSGLLFTINCDRFARPGRILAKIAGSEPLCQDEGNLLTL